MLNNVATITKGNHSSKVNTMYVSKTTNKIPPNFREDASLKNKGVVYIVSSPN